VENERTVPKEFSACGGSAPLEGSLLLQGLLVLVVNDNETNRRILRPMLENWGMLATIVASGAEGIKEMLGSTCSGRPFALVLLDGMPKMNGFMARAFPVSHFCDAFGGVRDSLEQRGKSMSFPIVGIGASAGGLVSISALLAVIPASTGMAYVFVQHLDPAHGSHLAKILSNRTALLVEEAREGKIFPNHLYVNIPNKTLTITSDVLHLRSRDPAERPHRPVDILFLSLAKKRGSNAIGVILSGSGSDGAKGIQAIKKAGGITFAEGENSASFFGMPSSAIQTGCVDFILNPRDIAQGLVSISQQVLSPKRTDKLIGEGPEP
jgi:hypothetical protein